MLCLGVNDMSREMKDSGVEWIGEIPEKWKVERLQWHLNEINKINNPIETDYILSLNNKTGVIPYEERDNMGNKAKEDCSKYKIAYPDTLVMNSMNVIIGSVGISHYYGCISPVYYVFKLNNKTELRYIDYIFRIKRFQKELRKYANGILEIRLRISVHDTLRRLIPIPDFKEQCKIADFLDNCCEYIDEIIYKTGLSIKEYKKMKRTIVTELVTFGSDCSKSRIKKWDLEKIPKNWRKVRLKFLMSDIVDCPHETPNYSFDGNYLVIRTADQDYTKLRTDENMYRLSRNEYSNRIRRMALEKNDIVYGREGERWGLACLVPKSDKYCLGQRMMQFRCKEKLIKPQFAVYALSSTNVRHQGEVDTLGSTSPHVNISTIKNYSILLPPLREQEKIVNYLDEKCEKIDLLIEQKEKLITELEEYKRSLIYEYVTGKKEVPEF